MKYIKNNQKIKYLNLVIKHLPAMFYYIKFILQEEFFMLKMLAKLAEKYAKSTNTACIVISMFHQPKMPASLIKKD